MKTVKTRIHQWLRRNVGEISLCNNKIEKNLGNIERIGNDDWKEGGACSRECSFCDSQILSFEWFLRWRKRRTFPQICILIVHFDWSSLDFLRSHPDKFWIRFESLFDYFFFSLWFNGKWWLKWLCIFLLIVISEITPKIKIVLCAILVGRKST